MKFKPSIRSTMKVSIILAILLSLQIQQAHSQDSCNGNRQSPIDINSQATTPTDSAVQYTNYDVPTDSLELFNNGRTAEVAVGSDNRPTISSPLMGENIEYILEQMHLHWGKTSADGSDHQIDGSPFPLELHLVHHNKAYNNIDEASGKENGLAVIGILFKVTNDQNSNFTPIIDNLNKIINPENRIGISNIIMGNLFPQSRSYYYYSGSLTTSPCDENVHWIVLESTNSISEQQLNEFRQLLNENGDPLSGNFRSIQPLNGRIVQKYLQPNS